jgi:hypothetical protein
MSYETGSVIGGVERGESDTDSALKSDRGNEGRVRDPEIIGGYESVEPRTERIDTDGSPRRTKSGRIDRRTIGGKRGTSDAAQKPNAIGFSQLDLTEVIFSMHQMLAGIVSVPELELDRGESEKLGDAIKTVGSYYGAVFDPKKVAIFNLCMVVGGIYGTRLFAIRNRIAAQKLSRAPNPKPTPIRTNNTAPQSPVNGNMGAGSGKATETVPIPMPGWGEGDASL